MNINQAESASVKGGMQTVREWGDVPEEKFESTGMRIIRHCLKGMGAVAFTVFFGIGNLFLVFFFFVSGLVVASTRNPLYISIWGALFLALFSMDIICIIRYVFISPPYRKRDREHMDGGQPKTGSGDMKGYRQPFPNDRNTYGFGRLAGQRNTLHQVPLTPATGGREWYRG